MMDEFDSELRHRLAALRERGLYRELRRVDSPQSPRIQIQGQALLNFSSNDYLGLAAEPALKAAAIQAIERYGAGAGASRLICGSLAPHHELDETLASFKAAEAALSFSSGYAAALGAICALVSQDDVVVLDKLVHACIVDAARLSGAKLRVFAHNDLSDLEAKLKWAVEKVQSPKPKVQSPKPRTLVVTESVFSMDGDRAPLRELVELKDRYGAWLMVDEAHATGLYGANRRGLAEEFGVGERIEVQMGTLGKALGASGGYICGSRALIDYLVNRARSFIFSTAPVPAAAAAAAAGVRFVQSPAGEARRRLLWQRVAELAPVHKSPQTGCCSAPTLINTPLQRGEGMQQDGRNRFSGFATTEQTAEAVQGHVDRSSTPLKRGVNERGVDRASEAGQPFHSGAMPWASTLPSAIIPLHVGDETRAIGIASALREQGVFIPAIRYPTVARGSARLRLTITAAHHAEDIAQLRAALECCSLPRT